MAKVEKMTMEFDEPMIEEPEVAVAEPVAEVAVEPKKKETKFRIGDIGQDVKALQRELGLPETGIYDAKTDKKARG